MVASLPTRISAFPDLAPIRLHVEKTYPDEGCGVILRVGSSGAFRIRPMRNAYDLYHQRDPKGFPRTAKTAYFFDPREWLDVCEEADRNGEVIWCIYHSHTDVGAYFSKEDKEMAAPDGEPLLPSTSYLVLAVDMGKTTAARLFWWENGDFASADVPIKI